MQDKLLPSDTLRVTRLVDPWIRKICPIKQPLSEGSGAASSALPPSLRLQRPRDGRPRRC